MLSEKTTQITLLSCSSHHIDVIVDGVGSHNPWCFIGTSQKTKTCEIIKDIHRDSNLPWLLRGDLNEILFNFEKKEGAIKSQHILDFFGETLEGCGLYDFGLYSLRVYIGKLQRRWGSGRRKIRLFFSFN